MSRQPDLNLDLPDEAPLKSELGPMLGRLAKEQVWIGTSSWKYPGWIGKVYSASRYQTRGRVSESRFKEDCLSEYGETFPTVCVDAAFYQYPDLDQVGRMSGAVPASFKFSFKVTDQLTVPVWPHHARHGRSAGHPNPHFLCAETFNRRFLSPLTVLREQLGVVVFEFSPLPKRMVASPREFIHRLDVFFSQVPKQFRYAVEIRNRELLGKDYLGVLKRHRVAHCLNSWTRMPPVHEQLEVPGIFTADFAVARFLLKPGRSYQDAVDRFSPYERVQETYPQGREAAVRLIGEIKKRKMAVFAYFNNRLEGNSLETIRAVAGARTC